MGWIKAGTVDTLAVHAALLPSGRIIYFGGSDYNKTNHDQGLIDHTRLFDCSSFAILPVPSPTTDMFCCGHALIEGGRLVVSGGTESYPEGYGLHHLHWPGTLDAWLFDDQSRTWTHLENMHGGRWYPTLLTLADGQVLAMAGHPSGTDSRHINNTPEIYDPEQNQWNLLGPLGDPGHQPDLRLRTPGFQVQYPRLHLLPNGDVFCVTPLYENNPSSVRYSPKTQQHSYVGGNNTNPDFQAAALVDGHNTTSVLLPFLRSQEYRASVLLCGSSQPFRIDLDAPAPVWRPSGLRKLQQSPARYNLNAVLLPTGDVFVCGGVSDREGKLNTSGIRKPEIYHPETDEWETLESEPANAVRNYHSVALLMPDGRVWTAGSNRDGKYSEPSDDTHEPLIEIYEPWYHFRPRPRITSCSPGFLHRHFPIDDLSCSIRTPEAGRIRRVAIIRAGSSTHAFNSDQRYVELEFRHTEGDEIRFTPPAPDGIAPPGDYLLFILDENGVPSTGSFVWVGKRPRRIRSGQFISVSQPIAIRNQDQRIEVFAIGAEGALWHRWQTAPNGPFADWDSLGGNVSHPCAIQNQDGRIEVFAIGATTDRALWHRWQTAPNGPFADWHSLGGNVVGQPFLIRNQDQRIEVFAIGTDGALWHRWQMAPNGPFADWDSLGGNVTQPFAIHNQDGRIEVFAIGATTDRALWHRWQTAPNGPFAEWHSLGGNVSQPFAIHNQDGRIEVFAIGPDGALWHRWQTAPNGPFADWHSLGGNVTQPFAIQNQDGRIEVFAIGTDGGLWHRWQTAPNGPFADWHSLGGNVTQPFAIHNQDGRIEVFAIGTDGGLWHRWQTAPNGPFAEWDQLGRPNPEL